MISYVNTNDKVAIRYNRISSTLLNNYTNSLYELFQVGQYIQFYAKHMDKEVEYSLTSFEKEKSKKFIVIK